VSAVGRRTFLVGATATVGVAAVAAFVPAAVVSAPPAWQDATVPGEPWHVDDMWGHLPRYAQPIPHAGVSYAPVTWERWDPIDHILMI
jgi:hypothetical protein